MKTSAPLFYHSIDSRISRKPLIGRNPTAGYCKTRQTPEKSHFFPFSTNRLSSFLMNEGSIFSRSSISECQRKIALAIKEVTPNDQPALFFSKLSDASP